MDVGSPGGRVQGWVMMHFQGRDEISQGELAAEARHSDLPAEACRAIDELPERSWSPQRAVHEIVDIMETQAGGGARGDANIPGRGGYGRSS
jgi:hypothetical protein